MQDRKVAVIGLGYVGLPLAIGFGKKLPTIGFDISKSRVASLKTAKDLTNEVSPEDFIKSKFLEFTNDASRIREADFVIVAVPTPVDAAKRPNFFPLESASRIVGKNLGKGKVIVFESTVYPGATMEICRPILESESGLIAGKDFFIGYSPERINPGDKEHSLEKIVKVVSGQDKKTLEQVAWLYEQVVEAGVFKASSIEVAEAAKVIENTQRDLNIALMNELAIIFNKIGIDTLEVLEAAGTKWNFLHFRPGLVGGHCIGVDPYYLTHKAELLGYTPQVILAGRKVNDSMGTYIASQTIKSMLTNGNEIRNSVVTILGITFKENCPDVRNSKVIDIIQELKSFNVKVQVYDPIASPEEVRHEYGIELQSWEKIMPASAVIAAVAHKQILDFTGIELKKKMLTDAVFIDVKSRFSKIDFEKSGVKVWRL